MRICLLITFLLLPSSAAAQKGVITYSGKHTIEVSRDLLIKSLPEAMRADTAMIEMVLADLPKEAISMQLSWTTRYSDYAILGAFNPAELIPRVDANDPDPVPMASAILGNQGMETFIDYEGGTVVTAVPHFFRQERYLLTEELDSTRILNWSLNDRDSTILGYSVLRAEARMNAAQMHAFTGPIPDGLVPGWGTKPSFTSGMFIAWYAPDVPALAGPWNIGGLPGAMLHLIADISLEGGSLAMEFAAENVETTLDKPVQAPTGTPISEEDYQVMIRQEMESLQEQIQNILFSGDR